MSLMIRVETLVIVILYSVKIKSTGIAFSTDVAEFENAKTMCSSDYQVADKDFFNSCQPKHCGRIDLKGHNIINSMVDDITQTAWISAYVVRSPVMEYKGCYKVKVPSKTIHQLDQHLNDTDNDVLKCSRFCKSTGCAQRGYVILLQGYKCYCAKKSLGTWTSNREVDEVSTSECLKDCPGDEIDRCGGTNIQIVAAYEFKSDTTGDADTHLGKQCFYTAPNRRAPSTLISGNCLQKLKFKCQTVDIAGSGGLKSVLTKQCYQVLVNWYDAQKVCLHRSSYLPTYTPSNDTCIRERDVDEENNWHNAFVKERIVWETENKPRLSYKCLAVELRKNNNYTLVAVNCTDKYKALCVLKSTTEPTIHLNTQQETTNPNGTAGITTEPTIHLNTQQETTNPNGTAGITTVSSVLGFSKQKDTKTTPSSPADTVIFGSVGGVTGLLFVVALVIVFIKRSSILKRIQGSTQQNNSPLYENDIGLQQQVYQDLIPDREDINSPYDIMHTNSSPLNENDIGLENQVYQDLTPDREDNNSPYDVMHTNTSPLNENDIGLENQVYQDLTPDREENNTPYDELHIKNTL